MRRGDGAEPRQRPSAGRTLSHPTPLLRYGWRRRPQARHTRLALTVLAGTVATPPPDCPSRQMRLAHLAVSTFSTVVSTTVDILAGIRRSSPRTPQVGGGRAPRTVSRCGEKPCPEVPAVDISTGARLVGRGGGRTLPGDGGTTEARMARITFWPGISPRLPPRSQVFEGDADSSRGPEGQQRGRAGYPQAAQSPHLGYPQYPQFSGYFRTARERGVSTRRRSPRCEPGSSSPRTAQGARAAV